MGALDKEGGKTSKDAAKLTCTVTVSEADDSETDVMPEALHRLREEVYFKIDSLEGKLTRRINDSSNVSREAPSEDIFSPQGLKAFDEIAALRQKVAAVESKLQEPTRSQGQDEIVVISAAQELLERRVALIEANPLDLNKMEQRVSSLEASSVSLMDSNSNGAPKSLDSETVQMLESRIVAVEAWARLGAVNAEKATRTEALETRLTAVESPKADVAAFELLQRRLASMESADAKTDGLSVTLKPAGLDMQALENFERRLT